MLPPIANRFIAGESTSDAISHTEHLNRCGISGIMNHLGEHHTEREEIQRDTQEYIVMMDRIYELGLDASVSIKPTQIGLYMDRDLFINNLENILEEAERYGVTVWLDMEDQSTTEDTIQAYIKYAEQGYDIGVCLQSNLRRTKDDLDEIKDLEGRIRLVKGAYQESEDISYVDRDRVDREYRDNIDFALDEMNQSIAIGTHDEDMIYYALERADEYGKEIEIQMLMGVNTDRQRELAKDRKVSQYVPYGDEWMSYIYRRMMERKENIVFAAKAILKG